MRLRAEHKIVASIIGAGALLTTIGYVGGGIAHADSACDSGGNYAVGGYPQTNLVPPGYTYIPTPGGIFPWENGGYDHGQQVGAHNVITTIDDYAAHCGGDIHLNGYSYGAGIVHTALATIDQRPYAARTHVTLVGDPRRPGGIEDTLHGASITGITMRGAGITPTHVAEYSNICNTGHDAICDLPAPWTNPLGTITSITGYFTGGHTHY